MTSKIYTVMKDGDKLKIYKQTMIEKRIRRDSNGFYNVQVRILPVEDWQPDEGWGTVFATNIYENAKKRLGEEPGKEVE